MPIGILKGIGTPTARPAAGGAACPAMAVGPAEPVQPGVPVAGDLEVNVPARVVLRDKQPVELTSAEFDLLQELVASVGRVVTRDQLYQKVLGRDFAVYDRSIDNHVSSVRRKLGPHRSGTDRIRAIRNIGYIYCLPVKEPRR